MEHLILQGIIHRDLAARNVLMDDQMNAKVSDFGLSKTVASKKEAIYSTSNVGPLRLMSPEALSKKKYSEKSDVWSFGVCCYEILAEKDPYWEITDPVAVAAAVMYSKVALHFPPETPEKLLTLEKLVFVMEADDRPTFTAILKILT